MKPLKRILHSKRIWRLACLIFLAVVSAVVYAGAYWLRFDGEIGNRNWSLFISTVALVVAVKTVVFASLHVYRGWTRLVSFPDLLLLARAATIASLTVVLLKYLLLPGIVIPRSILLMDWGLTIVVIGAMRSATRTAREMVAAMLRHQRPAFIVGTNDSGEALLRSIQRNSSLPYNVVGFISDDPRNVKSRVGGVPVVGTLAHTAELARRHDVAAVFIVAGELPGRQVRRLVETCSREGVSVRVLPSIEQMLSGSVAMRPRDVSIEDVLRRDPVKLDTAQLHRWLDGRRLLVTGSAGSIGSEIARQLLQFSPQSLVLLDRSENGQFFLERELRAAFPDRPIEIVVADICDAGRIDAVFAEHRPEIVFHAAAFKHVPLMEANPGEAVKNISLASKQLADLAERHGVESFVMISTDKAVNPTSVMGACKRTAELYVQALARESRCRFVTVRFGNVLDSAGSVVPIFRRQIEQGGPVTVTHPEMRRYFMTIPEASQLVIQAGAMGRGGEIFVLDMGQPIRILDLASDMIRLSGLKVGRDIDIEFTGKRPGEKLYEELHIDGEQELATAHPKIMIAQCRTSDFSTISQSMAWLDQLANAGREEIVQALSQIVPEYTGADAQEETKQKIRAAA